MLSKDAEAIFYNFVDENGPKRIDFPQQLTKKVKGIVCDNAPGQFLEKLHQPSRDIFRECEGYVLSQLDSG